MAQIVQAGPAQGLQKVQFVYQRFFQHRACIAACGGAQTQVFILQHGIQQGLGPVGAGGKQSGLKGRQSAAQFRLLGGQGGAQGAQQRGVQQIAEYYQRIQARHPFHTLHTVSILSQETTLSINSAAESCKIFTKKLDKSIKMRYSLTQIQQMLGWELVTV